MIPVSTRAKLRRVVDFSCLVRIQSWCSQRVLHCRQCCDLSQKRLIHTGILRHIPGDPLQRVACCLLVTTTALPRRVSFRPLGMMQTDPMHDFRILYLGRTGLVVSVSKPHILPGRAVFLPPEIQTRRERIA